MIPPTPRRLSADAVSQTNVISAPGGCPDTWVIHANWVVYSRMRAGEVRSISGISVIAAAWWQIPWLGSQSPGEPASCQPSINRHCKRPTPRRGPGDEFETARQSLREAGPPQHLPAIPMAAAAMLPQRHGPFTSEIGAVQRNRGSAAAAVVTE